MYAMCKTSPKQFLRNTLCATRRSCGLLLTLPVELSNPFLSHPTYDFQIHLSTNITRLRQQPLPTTASITLLQFNTKRNLHPSHASMRKSVRETRRRRVRQASAHLTYYHPSDDNDIDDDVTQEHAGNTATHRGLLPRRLQHIRAHDDQLQDEENKKKRRKSAPGCFVDHGHAGNSDVAQQQTMYNGGLKFPTSEQYGQ